MLHKLQLGLEAPPSLCHRLCHLPKCPISYSACSHSLTPYHCRERKAGGGGAGGGARARAARSSVRRSVGSTSSQLAAAPSLHRTTPHHATDRRTPLIQAGPPPHSERAPCQRERLLSSHDEWYGEGNCGERRQGGTLCTIKVQRGRQIYHPSLPSFPSSSLSLLSVSCSHGRFGCAQEVFLGGRTRWRNKNRRLA